MSLDFMIQDLYQRVSSDEKLHELLLHNLNIFHAIHTSYAISKNYPLNFDMRKDLWQRPDRLIFSSYFSNYFVGKYSPVKGVRRHLFATAKILEKVWQKICHNHIKPDQIWQNRPEEAWHKACRSIAENLAEEKLPELDSNLRDKHPAFKDINNPLQHLIAWVNECGADDNPEFCNVTFYKRMYAIPFMIAKSESELLSSAISVPTIPLTFFLI